MRILAIESSAAAASAALYEGERLIGHYMQDSGKTHSRTLMPIVEALLQNCDRTLESTELIAVAAGPGSFTGLRIGVATAKGLAWPGNKPCCGVSTLEAMAWNLFHMEGALLCPVMDARRGQVYNALFSARGSAPARLCPDRAISLAALCDELGTFTEPKILVGDGALLCYNYGKDAGLKLSLAPPHLLLQNACGVARAALARAREGAVVSAGALGVVYLRLPQAERERLKKINDKGEA